jgi:hypothetical protein
LIQEEIKRRSVENFLPSRLQSKNLKIKGEDRLRVFENRELRRIFGPKRDEVTGGWGRLHNEELHDLYSSSSIIRMMKTRRVSWARRVAPTRRRGTRIDY